MSDDPGERSIAIVDDDHAVRDSLHFLLEAVGYSVRPFASAAEFLLADIRTIACLILDHHMPEMTGLALVDRLRRDGVLLPIMLITGSPTPDMEAQAAALGISKVSSKPPTQADLLAFVAASASQ